MSRAPEEEEMDDIGLGAYQDDDEEGGLQGLADRQAPMPKWEVEGRQPILCFLITAGVALLVGVGAYSYYCPCLPRGDRLLHRPASPPSGFFIDPHHYQPGSFAGTRMLSIKPGDASGAFTLVGSDDGSTYWSLTGTVTDAVTGQVAIDFSPKGGPADASATVGDGKLAFGNGSAWTQLPKPFELRETVASGDRGGFYTDPRHYKPGSFAGTRMISSGADTDSLVLVGSDDGSTFWSLTGTFTDKAAGRVAIDFSPKGGPADASGAFSPGKLTFGDGNAWTQVGAGSLGGFYTDPRHYKPGSFAGTRMISSGADTDSFVLVGSDDGSTFWSLTGTFTDKAAGRVAIDFSPKGGPAGASGTYAAAKLTFGDGNAWEQKWTPPFGLGARAGEGVGGLYMDPNHYTNGTFAGTRMLSSGAADGPLTLVGSDDGATFWSLTGNFTAAGVAVDFSPKGGSAGLTAAYREGALTWLDERASWVQIGAQ